MASPQIVVSSGTLRQGNTIELRINYGGDALSFSHTVKEWTVFAEKNIRYEDGEFTYENAGKGTVYQESDTDNIVIRNLVTGRLFAIFNYTNIFNESYEIIQTFQVLPTTTITVDSDITEGDTADFSATSTLSSVDYTWTFGDDGSVITGAAVQKQINVDGYYDLNLNVDYSSATYSNGSLVVWDTNPTNRIPSITGSSLAGGVISGGTVVESITGTYLSNFDISKVMTLDINLSKSVENTYEAPFSSLVQDRSTYSIGTSGNNRIEYTEIDFGDNHIIRGLELGFEYRKLYKRSGEYFGTYTVHTVHTTSTGPDYRQTLDFDFSVEVSPFFEKWLKDHLSKKFYNSKGFLDLANAWGIQMDRVYNETQILLDSIDVEQIDEKFIRHFAATYGDFPEIYEKVGFSAFIDDKTDTFSYFDDYNFFDRLKSGNLTDGEKQEFLTYIQSSRNRLRVKGTPVSLEKAIAQFSLISEVKELWTDSFEPKANKSLTDEVFGGDKLVNNTGLRHRTVSSPLSDNVNAPIINSRTKSYIEINTVERSDALYYTPSTSTEVINGVKYAVFSKT